MATTTARQLALQQQLGEKEAQLADVVHKLSIINLNIHKLTQKFNIEAQRIHRRISKVQASRPRGNPANQWPHCPMTPRVSAFYQTKEFKETELRKNKDLLKQVYDHKRAILTSQCLVLKNEQFDLESQIRLIRIQLHE